MLKGKKTVILGVIVGIIGTIRAFATPEDAANAPTAEGAQAAFDGAQLAIAWCEAAAIWVTRVFTNTTIFKKE